MNNENLLEEMGYDREWSDEEVVLVINYTNTKNVKVCVSVFEQDDLVSYAWHPIYVAFNKKTIKRDDEFAWKDIADFVQGSIQNFLDNSVVRPTQVIVRYNSGLEWGMVNATINVIVDRTTDTSTIVFCNELYLKENGSPKFHAKWKKSSVHPVCFDFSMSEAKVIMDSIKTVDLHYNSVYFD